ncbi:MAG: AAA family ATPase [Mediterranea sp.]|jgi:exodeoxyribonuclease-5|nr:AAA family ATPase [Mediterranea sp.]
MINNYLARQIKDNFPYSPTFEQENVINALSTFLLGRSNDAAFILRGYAGTGKTSLIGALVKTMDKLQQKVILLAPTGRAAKVFSSYARHPAFTIHKKIYRQRSFPNDMKFSINDNLNIHTLFIVDEASMISNDGLSGSMFGTGRLLDDLIRFVYSGDGCRLLLMGDTAQLPPVGEKEGPALSAEAIKSYGLNVEESILTQVVRQEEDSGILWNATQLRQLITQDSSSVSLPKVRLTGFKDVKTVPGAELVGTISACYDRDGMEDSIIICRSNKRANMYNTGIRNTILYREEELSPGDVLMIAKNNYFWTEKAKVIDFIANGDIAVVRRVRRTKELYGFRFAEVLLTLPDHDNFELEANLILDTLHSDSPALPKEANDRLFYGVLEDYAGISNKRDRMKMMKADPYFNALQVKYAYAITCHKAQGGQWKNVFIDQGYMKDEYLTPDYLRWLYTAFTRAKEQLYLVNYPQEQIE